MGVFKDSYAMQADRKIKTILAICSLYKWSAFLYIHMMYTTNMNDVTLLELITQPPIIISCLALQKMCK
jgi:ABC-type antimicrobial peptide transport system ATPase subunit